MQKPIAQEMIDLAMLFDSHLLDMLRGAKGEGAEPLKAAELQVIRARLADCSVTSPATKGSAILSIAEETAQMDQHVHIVKSPLRLGGEGTLPPTSMEADAATDGLYFKAVE